MSRAVWNFSDHYFNVHILTKAEDGRFHYTGIGRFCDTWEEVVDFARYYGCIEIKKVNY